MSQPFKKGIIFNADDFGPMDFINDGIRAGIDLGIVNSVSAFVTFGDQALDEVKALHKKKGKEVKIGLHFTLTAGSPVGSIEEVPSLYKNYKKGAPRFPLIQHLDLGKISRKEVEIEMRLQLEKLGKALGGISQIDHFNSHQGLLTAIPSFWKIALNLAKEYQLPFRSPATYEMSHSYYTDSNKPLLPITRSAILPGIISLLQNPKTASTFKYGNRVNILRRKQAYAKKEGYGLPDYSVQSYYRQPSKDIIRKLLEDIAEGEVAELMLHLGKGNFRSEYQELKHWGIAEKSLDRREEELKVLKECSNLIKEQMDPAKRNISRVYYGDLPLDLT